MTQCYPVLADFAAGRTIDDGHHQAMKFFTGDGWRRGGDGYYWITGRVDDVIDVSSHRIGSAKIESALVAHCYVAEAAVVGMPHDLKVQGIYASVTLNIGEEGSDALRTSCAAGSAGKSDRPRRAILGERERDKRRRAHLTGISQ